MDLLVLLIAFLAGAGIGSRVSYEVLKDRKSPSTPKGESGGHAA